MLLLVDSRYMANQGGTTGSPLVPTTDEGIFYVYCQYAREHAMMKTKLLYHENSYTYECTAKVVAAEGDEIALDATVFFPGGGGQMADRGIISWDNAECDGSVIALNKRDDVVWHTLDCLPPPVGTEVTGSIDWDFRYHMMRTHTALHILCGVIFREFGVQ